MRQHGGGGGRRFDHQGGAGWDGPGILGNLPVVIELTGNQGQQQGQAEKQPLAQLKWRYLH
ncbi:hypothetical protein D3C85_1458650 [compost metagenome]